MGLTLGKPTQANRKFWFRTPPGPPKSPGVRNSSSEEGASAPCGGASAACPPGTLRLWRPPAPRTLRKVLDRKFSLSGMVPPSNPFCLTLKQPVKMGSMMKHVH